MTTPQCAPARRYLRHGMLPQIAAFEAVVRLGSATRAAFALSIAQPTLSGHLRKLSETLGVRLFDIRAKRLVPTDAALVLLQATHEIFAAFERCEQGLAVARWRPHREDAPDGADQASSCDSPSAFLTMLPSTRNCPPTNRGMRWEWAPPRNSPNTSPGAWT